MNYEITLFFLGLLFIYTLYYTYEKDFGMFLYVLLLFLIGLTIYQYIESKIEFIHDKIKNLANKIEENINNITNKF